MAKTDRSRRVRDLFTALLPLSAEERRSQLERRCRKDAALRREVEALVQAHDQATTVLRRLDRLLPGAPAADPLVGRRILHYEVEQRLGQGGMGVVYRARDVRLGRAVALKFLPPETTTDPEALDRFADEARSASGLDHPNICAIYDVAQAGDGRPFIVMGWYPGPTLKERIAQGRLPVGESVGVALQVARGLACAHRAGITHRDIKPANLIFSGEGEIKILDFGLAKRAGQDRTRSGMALGTAAYMSPEQVSGETVDARTDVWALGVVLYEMLAGIPPFRGSTLAAVLHAVLMADPAPIGRVRSDVPPTLVRILERALARNRADRFADAGEMAQALAGAEGAESAGAETRVRLPAARTSFVGRTQELADLRELLQTARLVTLTGPPGIGKSRLSLRVAAESEASFRDGTLFVPLAAVEDPAGFAPALAHALGLAERASRTPLQLMREALAPRELLLILDNFEQIADAAPDVGELLSAAPRLRLLVTSRIPLRIEGEHEFPLLPLDLPPSTELFVQRARAVDPRFRPGEADAATIAEICRRLDGLPLAIELAAARVKLLPPPALLARLDRSLDLLKAERSDRPERHRTLRGAIAWSYDLLSPEEQGLFRRMGIFRGGFTLESAAAVAGLEDATDLVGALADKSLLRREERSGREPRFLLLETVREFARERLSQAGEREQARRAHGRVFLDLAESMAPHLTGPRQAESLDALERDHDNLRAAMEDGEGDVPLRLGAALWRFWVARGYMREGAERLLKALRAPAARARTGVRALALRGAGTIAHERGDYLEAAALVEESLGIFRELGDRHGAATALNSLAWLSVHLGDYAAADERGQEALRLMRELEDERGVSVALNNLGWLAHHRADYARAAELHRDCLERRRRIGDARGAEFSRTNLGWALACRGEHAEAAATLSTAVAALRAMGDHQLTAHALGARAVVHRREGELDAAASALEDSLRLWDQVDNRWGRAYIRGEMSEILLARGDLAGAEAAARESIDVWTAMREPWGTSAARRRLGAVAAAGDRLEEARRLLDEARQECERLGDRHGAAQAHEALAAVDAREKRWADVARRLGAAERMRTAAGAPPDLRERDAIAALNARAAELLGPAALEKAWQEGLRS